MTPRRSLIAAAACAVLIAVMWTPSVSAADQATPDQVTPSQAMPERPMMGTQRANPVAANQAGDTDTVPRLAGAPANGERQPQLAATGSIDTTPYLLGGAAFLGVGTGLVLFARRRELADTDPVDTPPPGS